MLTNDELDALYATLPVLECQQKCGSCCGPIKVGPDEWRRLVERVGAEPSARTLMLGLRCPWVTPGGLCSVYDVRPMICRLWGAVRMVMACPHGCKPERWLSEDDAWATLAQVGVMR